jgi:hypothetical protein
MAPLFVRLTSPERIAFESEIRARVMSGVDSDLTILPAVPRRRPSSMSAWSSRPMLRAKGARASMRSSLLEITEAQVSIL